MTAMPKKQPVAFDAVPLAERCDALLDRALELGALPTAIQDLLELTRRDDAQVAPVVDALARDPGLTAAVLRAANSPAYGQSRAIGDLPRAVMVLGMQELHDIAAGSAMMAAFSRPDPLSERIQSNAAISAAIAQKLAARLGASPSAAYLSGLMCELGALACLALDPGFGELYRTNDGLVKARFAQESAKYGGTTPEIGGRILAASALPSEVCGAVATTGLEPEEGAALLGRLVAFARLAPVALLHANRHGDPDLLRSELTHAAAAVGLAELDPELLTQTCLAAASAAQLTLPGELGLAQSAPANDVKPAPGNRASTARERPGAGIYLALAAGALALGALTWLLFQS